MLIVRAAVLILACAGPVQAAEFAVTQCVLPTSNGGTVDCTKSGFGTVSAAVVWGGYGATNGTVVDHAGFWIGAYDGTNQVGMGFASEDALADSDTGFVRDTNSSTITLSPAHVQDGDCQASIITDGIRLTCADAPPTAYRVNVLLVGGAGVSNVSVGGATGNATQDATTAVSAPGFLPDLIVAWAQVGTTSTSGANYRLSLGLATCPGGIVQRSIGYSDADAAASMNTSSMLATNRLIANGVNGVTLATLELTSCDANGFTVTTRDAATGPAFQYLAVKLTGLSVKLMTDASPTATGNEAVTGVGFQPQAGLMLQGEFAAVDTLYSTDSGEVFGFSAFTASDSATTATAHEDSDGTSNTESMTDSTVCRTRKDAVDFATCTLVSLDPDGATFNYSTAPAAATQRAILFVQAASAGGSMMRRRIQ